MIHALAERNARLGEELDRMADELGGMDAKEQEAAEEAKRIETALNTARQKIEIAGLSQVLGQVLYEERRSLPDPRLFHKQTSDLEQRIAEVSLAQLQLEEERRELRDPEDYVATLTSQLPAGEQASDWLMQELGSLVENRLGLVDQGIEMYSAYLRALGELDFAQRRLLDAVETYNAFLDKRLLWVKSSPAVGLESITAIPWQVLRLLSPTGWSDVASTITRRATQSPLLLMAVAIFLLLHWKRGVLRDALEATGRNVGKITKDRLQDTFRAFLIVVLLALPAPFLMFAMGWELLGAIDASQFTKVIGGALTTIAPIFFELQALRIVVRPGSVAAVHFGWADDGLERLHHDLKWFIPVVVFGGLVTVAAINEDAEFLGSGLGRLAFVTLMAAFTFFFYRLAHPTRGTLVLFFAGEKNSAVVRFRYLWFALLVGPPVAAAVVSILGFLYTGGTLIDHILRTLWLVVLLIIVHQVIVRWLLINRRRLALQAARARLQAAREARATETQPDDGSERIDLEVREPEVDLTALDQESRKLLDSVFSLASLVGIWLIWKEILPAFEILNEVTLWTYTLTTGDTAERIPITLADLGGAVLVVMITVIAVKRLPAFLEIVLLQRLDMTAAGRYTATALTTYTIAAIGIAWTFSVLGGSWSEIQWLVAALGVGIGFGLQEIVANFISGLIILFERPIRVGDVVTVGNVDGVVTKIRIRATTIRDWDRKELLVPNKEFITQQLLNWSLSDQVTRIPIIVGVAYGSDVQRAMLILEDIARAHPRVLDEPAPFVVFEEFGDNALALSLRCYIESIDYRLATITDLNIAVNQKFAEAGIEIAFPQRDVHLDASKPLDIRIHRAPSSG
jgi:potassium efflux system protein